jgi:hypothetical protein
MSTGLVTRTAVIAVYLIALLLNGRADLPAVLLGAAIVALWVIPLLRDRMTRHDTVPTAPSR